MAIKTFNGQEHLVEAISDSLSQDFSAVVVRGAVPHARRLFAQRGVPIEIFREAFPTFAQAEVRLEAWAKSQVRRYDGIGLGHERRGGKTPHFDGYHVVPFAMSLGIQGQALWHSQIASDGQIQVGGEQFDKTRHIDEFRQSAGDLVIIPGIPNPSIHEVLADETRLARVFTTHSDTMFC